MDSGLIGLVKEGELADPHEAEMSDSREQRVFDGTLTFRKCVGITDTQQATLTTLGDVSVFEGAAYRDEVKETKEWVGETLPTREDVDLRHRTGADFAAVPGEADKGFMAIGSSKADWIFDHMAASQTHCTIEAVRIDLRSFLENAPDEMDVNALGRNHLQTGATTMEWVDEPMDVPTALDYLEKGVGLTLDVTWPGVLKRAFICKSGWVDCYEGPSETHEFMSFVDDYVREHTFSSDDDAEFQREIGDVAEDAAAGDD